MVEGTLRTPSGARAAIARRMSASKRDVPHFYAQTEVVLDMLLAETRGAAAEPPAMKVTLTAGLAQACTRALREVPIVNSIWTEEGLLEATEVNLGIAMALERGLLVPVVLGAQGFDLRGLAVALDDLRGRAESSKLRPAELTEGTFTLSNLGMAGVTAFAAIVSQPQVAILATGRAVDRCVVLDGEIVPASVMTATLSADHRAIDGMDAARFLAAFKASVEGSRAGADQPQDGARV
jgi:pyruvate dehydrogenase E2 component (dihydrolipoamide acetyltransferase)